MKLVIYTQCHENYGSPDQPIWKAKGGDVYVVPNVTVDLNAGVSAQLANLVDAVRHELDQNGEMFQEYIVDYSLESDDFLSEWEQDQLKYDGKITYPAKVLQVGA